MTPAPSLDDVLDKLEWKPIDWSGASRNMPTTPHAVKWANLHVAGTILRVYQLNDGRRLIDEFDVKKFVQEAINTEEIVEKFNGESDDPQTGTDSTP